ncbi:MAG: twin-arginine translocation signal domain-containing protein, partial [Cyclobacteriaceae bacterium]
MNLFEEAIIQRANYNTRRHFLKKCTSGIGALALGSLMGCDKLVTGTGKAANSGSGFNT